jgi:hypothetical protein
MSFIHSVAICFGCLRERLGIWGNLEILALLLLTDLLRKSQKKTEMPSSVNGTGTMYYGHREIDPDGSYVTTEWITFAWIPLVPLKSYRVLPHGQGQNFLVYQSQGYSVRQVPVNGEQIRNVYGVAVGVVGTLCTLGYFLG